MIQNGDEGSVKCSSLQNWRGWNGNELWNTDGGKQVGNGSRSKVKVYLHQSKKEEGCEGPAQESRAHLAVGCWQPEEKESIPLRKKCGGQGGREGQSQEVIGHGEKRVARFKHK